MTRRFISAWSPTSIRDRIAGRRRTCLSRMLGRWPQAWLAAGGDVRLPQDTEWGQHEGVLIDLDGNVIRFGSPIKAD
jgi:hypothetical protein